VNATSPAQRQMRREVVMTMLFLFVIMGSTRDGASTARFADEAIRD
jgi:hypothetical protein